MIPKLKYEVEDIRGMRVYCYRNLHTKKISVMHRGRIIKHVDSILLDKVEFRVRELGRQRVLVERQKNVHAFVIGVVREFDNVGLLSYADEVKYNPYLYMSFVRATGGCIFKASNAAIFSNGRIFTEVGSYDNREVEAIL